MAADIRYSVGFEYTAAALNVLFTPEQSGHRFAIYFFVIQNASASNVNFELFAGSTSIFGKGFMSGVQTQNNNTFYGPYGDGSSIIFAGKLAGDAFKIETFATDKIVGTALVGEIL